MSKEKLNLILCADTEDNHPNYLPSWKKYGSNYDKNPPEFRFGWTRYWDDLNKLFDEFNVKISWFVRVDTCIKDEFIRKFKKKILKLKKDGHEIGIHIHTLTWDGKIWRQSMDPNEQEIIVKKSVKIFEKTLGFPPKVSR
ncbi:hypothetical protein GF327_09530, partial [Candidatus Woesearchaeota archaeon]|nr:hypothetical protein [Candidatus Woesearchaeota archaeon]